MNWTLCGALAFWKVASPTLDRHGFLCGIYGSVLKYEEGRDLDLLVIPKRINVSIENAVNDLVACFQAKIGRPYTGVMGTKAYGMTLLTGQVVDLQFYKPAGPKDAEDFYVSGYHGV